jgi:hypothetical protein
MLLPFQNPDKQFSIVPAGAARLLISITWLITTEGVKDG